MISGCITNLLYNLQLSWKNLFWSIIYYIVSHRLFEHYTTLWKVYPSMLCSIFIWNSTYSYVYLPSHYLLCFCLMCAVSLVFVIVFVMDSKHRRSTPTNKIPGKALHQCSLTFLLLFVSFQFSFYYFPFFPLNKFWILDITVGNKCSRVAWRLSNIKISFLSGKKQLLNTQ